MRTKEPAIIQLVSILQELSIIRAGDLSKYGIHPEVLKRAVHRGLVVKIGRGIYTRKHLVIDIERQILLAKKRGPRGVVCLESALMFHWLLPMLMRTPRHGAALKHFFFPVGALRP
jgi:Transcriptional regulator, AbiEi antitoxin